VLQLSKWYHKWRIRYHLCYKAKVVLNRNNQFTWNNSICENHKYGVKDTSVKTSNSKLKLGLQIIEHQIIGNRYEPKIILEDKVYV